MGRREKKFPPYPSLEEIEREMERLIRRAKWKKAVKSTVGTLVVVAAIAVLIAMLYMPVLRVSGTSMSPNLNDKDIIVGVKSGEFATGQVCCFYYNNRLLLKRVVANGGDWVEIDEDGYVYVNGVMLDEPYVQERCLGICDIEFPYQVPDGKLFVLGDHRSTSVDSRSSVVGCVDVNEIVGKMFFRIWPLEDIGPVQ